MNIPPISNLWRMVMKRERLVPKISKMTDSEHLLGSDDAAREALAFSEKKQQEALVYGRDGQIHDLNENSDHPKIDERM